MLRDPSLEAEERPASSYHFPEREITDNDDRILNHAVG